jgi:hypothetical protein
MPVLTAHPWYSPNVRVLQRMVRRATEPPQPTWWNVWIDCIHRCCRRNPAADGVEDYVRATSTAEALSKAVSYFEDTLRRRCRSCKRPLALGRLRVYDTGETEL